MTLWTVACQAPLPMRFSGKNTGVGCHALLQGIFLIQCSNLQLLWLLHCRWILYCWGTGEALNLLYDLTIPLLGTYPEKTITFETDTCIPMFIAALFTIARTWKQPRCPSRDEWIKKLWYIYIAEYYSAVKRNTLASVLMRWINLEPIILSEASQKEKNKYCIFTHIYGI